MFELALDLAKMITYDIPFGLGCLIGHPVLIPFAAAAFGLVVHQIIEEVREARNATLKEKQ